MQDEEAPNLKATGARGAAAHEMMRRYFERNPQAFTNTVVRNMARAQAGRFDGDDPRICSMRNHLVSEIPVGSARTLGYLGFGIAMVWDQLYQNNVQLAQDTLSRLMVAVEQAAIDQPRFDLAWPFTHLPEPPWPRLQATAAARRSDGDPQFGTLSDPSWITTALALRKDLASLAEGRKRKPPGKGDKDEK